MRVNSPRTLRAEQVHQTRQRIIGAARALFLNRGYAAATLQAVAAEAGVAVETVYGRFGSKTNLLNAILEDGIGGTDGDRDILEQPEIENVRQCSVQREQVRLLASFSRGILQRTDEAHRILRSAAATDTSAALLQQRDNLRRVHGQRAYIDMLLSNGPLREGLTPAEASDTYSALANPEAYTFLVGDRAWSPDRYERWLSETLTHTLLPDG